MPGPWPAGEEGEDLPGGVVEWSWLGLRMCHVAARSGQSASDRRASHTVVDARLHRPGLPFALHREKCECQKLDLVSTACVLLDQLPAADPAPGRQ